MNKIYVTQPALPPLDEFNDLLKQIWESRIITNNGSFHQQFESKLAEYLGVKYVSLFSNGTMALISALQAMNITGEVITTPFSFVATTHALWWNNIKPVFADIEPGSFNIDPAKIEGAITPRTTAIMPVHVYGNPCRLNEIERIARINGLKVIYDAAHSFGVKINGIPLVEAGDLSVMSFHATKVFSTIEGGAIISRDPEMKQRIDFLKNFGFADEVTVVAPGINAKMNELQAAFGLLQLKYVDGYIDARRRIAAMYRKILDRTEGLIIPDEKEGTELSYSYFPILIDESKYGLSRDDVYNKLRERDIYGRRYFYPLISNFPSYRSLLSADPRNLPVANRISGQIICLPIYPALSDNDVEMIASLISRRFL